MQLRAALEPACTTAGHGVADASCYRRAEAKVSVRIAYDVRQAPLTCCHTKLWQWRAGPRATPPELLKRCTPFQEPGTKVLGGAASHNSSGTADMKQHAWSKHAGSQHATKAPTARR